MSKSWKNGSTREWRRLRVLVLMRDNYACQLRLPGCTGVAQHVHHTLGRAVTGDDLDYMVAACRHCNLAIGQPKLDPPSRGVTPW